METTIPEDAIAKESEDKVPELGAAAVPRRARSISLRPRTDHAVHFFSGAPEDGVIPGVPSAQTRDELMGPIVRRKKVVSMPLGGDPRRNDFFGGDGFSQDFMASGRARQFSGGSFTRRPSSPSPHRLPRERKREGSLMKAILRRKQVSLDLFAPEGDEEAEAFFAPLDEKEIATTEPEGKGDQGSAEVTPATEDEAAEAEKKGKPVKLFKPLVFSKPVKSKGGGGHGGGHAGVAPQIDDEVREYLELQLEGQQKLRKILEELAEDSEVSVRSKDILQSARDIQEEVDGDTEKLQHALGMERVPANEEGPVETGQSEEDRASQEEIEKKAANLATSLEPIGGEIKKARRNDYIKTGIVFAIMTAFLGVVLGWHTEIDEAYAVYGPVGLACSTQCLGHKLSQNYFRSHGQFDTGDFIRMYFRLDPHPDEQARALVQIYGRESGHTKKFVLH